MTKEEIIAYVCDTPENSNPAVLGSLLDQFAAGQQGSGEVWQINFIAGRDDHGATISSDVKQGQISLNFGDNEPAGYAETSVFFLSGESIISKTAHKTDAEEEETYAIGWSKTPNGSLVTFPYTPAASNETLYAIYGS